MPACAVEPSDADEATSLGEARDAVTSGCVTIQRGTLGNVEDAHIATDPGDPTRANKNWGASQGFSAGLTGPQIAAIATAGPGARCLP